MANLVYLTLNGQLQGLISAGCSSLASIGNRAQLTHLDQILIYELSHGLTRNQNVNHQTVVITKPVDKSSPLLNKAITDNEILTCDFDFYRTNRAGMNELYYKIKLTEATIKDIRLSSPDSLNNPGGQPIETVSFNYNSVTWEHCLAGTSAYSLWSERVF
ncbi:Hcp family type VI secretion system effector [Salmonella enterica]|nr:Hcp family type VI secretion system effector [Salmonella enterica]EAX6603024.1 Hcp family type VI secretion system effector [Salmonella enterica]